MNKVRRPYRCSIKSNLICSGVKEPTNVSAAFDTSANCDRDKDFVRGFLQETSQLITPIKSRHRVYIEQFIGAGLGVLLSQFRRLPHNPQAFKLNTLHHVRTLDVQPSDQS